MIPKQMIQPKNKSKSKPLFIRVTYYMNKNTFYIISVIIHIKHIISNACALTRQEKESFMRCMSVCFCRMKNRLAWSKLHGMAEMSSSTPCLWVFSKPAPETHTQSEIWHALAYGTVLCWKSHPHHKRWPVNACLCCKYIKTSIRAKETNISII